MYLTAGCCIYVLVVIAFRLQTKEASMDGEMKIFFRSCIFVALVAYFIPFLSKLVAVVSCSLAITAYFQLVRGAKYKPVDMSGKVCIVTGANTGIGLETARELVRMGAHVILACRTEVKAKQAIVDIVKSVGGEDATALENARRRATFLPLDLCSLDSIHAFVEEFTKLALPLHVLVNNAGVMMPKRVLTNDGMETMMAANHLGPFLLTQLLLPHLQQQHDARVVNVASCLHKIPQRFEVEDVMSERPGAFSLFATYAQTKLANVLFSRHLAARLQQQQQQQQQGGPCRVSSNSLHPGNVITDVTRNMGPLLILGYRLVTPLMLLIQKPRPVGAYTSLYLATAPELAPAVAGSGGKYYLHCAEALPSSASMDDEVAEQLWRLSEKLVGLKTM